MERMKKGTANRLVFEELLNEYAGRCDYEPIFGKPKGINFKHGL